VETAAATWRKITASADQKAYIIATVYFREGDNPIMDSRFLFSYSGGEIRHPKVAPA